MMFLTGCGLLEFILEGVRGSWLDSGMPLSWAWQALGTRAQEPLPWVGGEQGKRNLVAFTVGLPCPAPTHSHWFTLKCHLELF